MPQKPTLPRCGMELYGSSEEIPPGPTTGTRNCAPRCRSISVDVMLKLKWIILPQLGTRFNHVIIPRVPCVGILVTSIFEDLKLAIEPQFFPQTPV